MTNDQALKELWAERVTVPIDLNYASSIIPELGFKITLHQLEDMDSGLLFAVSF